MKNIEKLCLFSLFVAICAVIFACATSGGKITAYDSTATSWDWVVNGDADNGGTSTIAMTEGVQEGVPAYSFKGNITNKYEYGFVNVKLYPDPKTLDILKTISAFSFRILGDGDRYAVKITTSDITDYAYFEYAFDTVEGQPVTVIVPIEYLMQPSWGKTVGTSVNLANAQFIEFQTTRNGSPGPFEFKLWDVRLYKGGVPSEKDVNKSKPKAAAAPAAAKGIGGDLGAFALNLNDNFQYGDGYQGVLSDRRLFNGHKIVPGESYTLKITYTASRDLEDVVLVGLVDTTPAAKYWTSLSWLGDDGMVELKQSKAGEVVSATINFKTVAEATGTSGAANALVFITKGEGKKGVANSGKQKAVTLNFTEFVFKQE
ncbi:CIA30 family protein [Treponema sp. R80B11-R83G3]